MSIEDLPFFRIEHRILEQTPLSDSNVVLASVQLVYECRDTGRMSRRLMEVAVKDGDHIPPRRLKRAIVNCAWTALEGFYAGDEPLADNIFADGTAARGSQAPGDERYAIVANRFEPMQGMLLRWLGKSNTPASLWNRHRAMA